MACGTVKLQPGNVALQRLDGDSHRRDLGHDPPTDAGLQFDAL